MNNHRGPGQPDGKDDVINKYGTYEIQRTNGMENDFPLIAQGLPQDEAKRMKRKFRQWYRNQKQT